MTRFVPYTTFKICVSCTAAIFRLNKQDAYFHSQIFCVYYYTISEASVTLFNSTLRKHDQDDGSPLATIKRIGIIGEKDYLQSSPH